MTARTENSEMTSPRWSILKTIARRIRPLAPSASVQLNETFGKFIWGATGFHQFYVGAVAISVTLFNFIPIELQRRVIDEAVATKDIRRLAVLGAVYLAILGAYSSLKYVLMIYQGWMGESAIKTARDQLAEVACKRAKQPTEASGQTANVLGNEVDTVGGFVGTSISEFVVNTSMMMSVFAYMIYMEPLIAIFSLAAVIPQFFLARYLQQSLNQRVERQIGLVRKLGDQAVDRSSSKRAMLHATHRTTRTIFQNRIELYLLKFGLKSLLNIANSLGSLMVLLAGGYLVITGQTTIGTVMAFISGFQRLSDPTGDLLDFYRSYSQAKVQYRMIVDWVAGPDVDTR
ncbi:ABC transporter transmembrane domain-containing protein [Ensifer sp. B1-9]|uniref:ABC transporter transmembrane domain-containing protein n=1 Tax=Ensifer sp. B1-9 TaxID=3141455 RepID=UPI003D22FDF5